MEEQVEELLERLWVWEEEVGKEGLKISRIADEIRDGERIRERIDGGYSIDLNPDELTGELKKMADEGFISIRDDHVSLEEMGREVARTIIRNHRLAEVLLMEVFEVEDNEAHASACKFEHILSSQVTDRVCTFLGHPPTCPHGKVIPRGKCCAIFDKHMEPLVIPLTHLRVGKSARIVYITPSSKMRLERLGSLGLSPGGTLKLKQRYPSYVVEVDETTIAVDKDVGKEIFVREVS